MGRYRRTDRRKEKKKSKEEVDRLENEGREEQWIEKRKKERWGIGKTTRNTKGGVEENKKRKDRKEGTGGVRN